MKKIIVRTITGLLFVAVLIGAITWNKYSVAGLFYFISILGLYEFFKLMEKAGFSPKKSIATLIGSIIYIIITLYSFQEFSFKFLLFIFPLLVFLVVFELFRENDTPISNIAFSIMGILYVIIPFSILNFFAYQSPYNKIIEIQEDQHQYWLLLGFFVLQWSYDSGAYTFGSLFGKNKLFRRISPNKTWEGAIGGLILAILTGYLISFFTNSSHIHWMNIALLIVVFGTLGDLTESQIKRSCGVKDSGNILPGHGGILDRFDGVLFSAPFVLAYLHFFDLFNIQI